jgi:L-glyceraldehyde 3-phosphate reductase
VYIADNKRYDSMHYRRSGRSGIQLPAVSLGLWHNFGGVDNFENSRAMLRRAFDLGITHFDLANNYGPPYGSAEETFGQILKKDFRPYRDELIISTKAGWDMWPGPYGDLGSRKYLLASLDQSLKRMGLKYVDIFYHHRPDPDTPMEESLGALDTAVRSGRALYAGISAYDAEQTAKAVKILRDLGTPCLIHQPKYSMFVRDPEQGLLDVLEKEGVGAIVFSPLAQGLLSDRYLKGIPSDSRAARDFSLKKTDIEKDKLAKVGALNEIAAERGQTLAEMAVAWVLRDPRVTSALVGTSKVSQVDDNVAALKNLKFSAAELSRIDGILAGKQTA